MPLVPGSSRQSAQTLNEDDNTNAERLNTTSQLNAGINITRRSSNTWNYAAVYEARCTAQMPI